jgi:hypothetical protein
MMQRTSFPLLSPLSLVGCIIEQIPYSTEEDLGEDLDLEAEDDSEEEDYEKEELCDYTGEQCIGNKMFCEECEVMRAKWRKER